MSLVLITKKTAAGPVRAGMTVMALTLFPYRYVEGVKFDSADDDNYGTFLRLLRTLRR